jgi:hypothetical protein
MAHLDFPATPTVGDFYPVPAVPGVPQYKWDGTVWTATVLDQIAFVKRAGDAMTGPGPLVLYADPAAPLQAATKQYVDAGDAGLSGFRTGDAKATFQVNAQTGWIFANDGSIGSAASNATTRANADTQPLYQLLYDNISFLVVQDSAGTTVARGANSAADFTANRRLVIPKALGRSLAVAGTGAGLSAHALGSNGGAETTTQSLAQLAPHLHDLQIAGGSGAAQLYYAATWGPLPGLNSAYSGGGSPFPILDPTVYMNFMIKL